MYTLRIIDFFFVTFIIGTTTWFFFLQSPLLLRKMKREKFVQIQMMLTKFLFKVLTISLFIVLMLNIMHTPFISISSISIIISFLAVLINFLIIVPKAIKAGGQSFKEIRGQDNNGTISNFASKGVSNHTKILHRTVVIFVVIMLVGTAIHGISLLKN